MKEGVLLAELRDDIVPDGALDRVRLSLFGVPVTVKAYAGILTTLGAGGYRDETLGLSAIDYGDGHFTCFQFDYDWRRSNVENAARLHRFILEKQKYVADELGKLGQAPDEVKFDIVAHSMGGLVARYCLMYGDAPLPADGSQPPLTWAGAKHVDQLIMVGTPNAGAAGAVDQLVNGSQLSPILPKYQPAILGTMPAIYELLPRVRHGAVVDANDSSSLDFYDATLWERMNWGLVSDSQEQIVATLLPDEPDPAARRRIARDHLAKCLDNARRFHDALDVTAELPHQLRMILFAGDAVQTVSVIGVNQHTGAIKPLGTSPGDGTVTRASALLDERTSSDWSPRVVTPIYWSQVNFFFTNHLGLTTDPAFTDNVLYLLLEQPALVSRTQ